MGKNIKFRKKTNRPSPPLVKGETGGINSKLKTRNSRVAFLWDESFLWGLMAFRALRNARQTFDLIRAEDVRAGVLDHYNLLFVPGGWASNKKKALSEKGAEAIREFIRKGGNYLGFCGGAGLAIKAEGCLGLLDIRRRQTRDRVPSFSGRIELNTNSHPIWEGLIKNSKFKIQKTRHLSLITHHSSLIFNAWWPSQFVVEDKGIQVLARYGEALSDAFSSDLNVGDVEANGGWKQFEKLYGINLDPRRLYGEPAVVEGRYGDGRVVLSLVHFDTPGDDNGGQVLCSLREYLTGEKVSVEAQKPGRAEHTSELPDFQASGLFELCSELIELGQRNFLWFWRNEMLLQWRRGVRGLEYNTLYVMMRDICDQTSAISSQLSEEKCVSIRSLLVPFVDKASMLLVLERRELQKGNHITYEKCDNPEIRQLREELFSYSKSHGGMFKELIDRMDTLLYSLIKGDSEL